MALGANIANVVAVIQVGVNARVKLVSDVGAVGTRGGATARGVVAAAGETLVAGTVVQVGVDTRIGLVGEVGAVGTSGRGGSAMAMTKAGSSANTSANTSAGASASAVAVACSRGVSARGTNGASSSNTGGAVVYYCLSLSSDIWQSREERGHLPRSLSTRGSALLAKLDE